MTIVQNAHIIFIGIQVMTMIDRYLRKDIKADLKDKMVFISGPRQAGKTTLALSLLSDSSSKNPAYLNYDYIGDRELILKGHFPGNQKINYFR